MNTANKTGSAGMNEYLKKDDKGNAMETEEQLFRRVAKTVARADVIYDVRSDIWGTESAFYEMMMQGDFLPGTAILKNAGIENGMLMESFALPVGPDTDSVFETLKKAILARKQGAKIGFGLSHMGKELGGVSGFEKMFIALEDAVCESDSTSVSARGILRVDHPEILAFIEGKNWSQNQRFRRSVGITERFLTAAENEMEYNLVDPVTGNPVRTVNAGDVLHQLVLSVWETGQPDIVFLDRINRDNKIEIEGKLEILDPACNQCLFPCEGYCSGAINLGHMVGKRNGHYAIDLKKLEETVHGAVHFLDNVIDISGYPTEQMSITTKLTRKLGLGVMGWSDMLDSIGVAYQSKEAVALGERLMNLIQEFAQDASENLAEIRGAFPLFEDSSIPKDLPQRNCSITMVATEKKLADLAGCQKGIAPMHEVSPECDLLMQAAFQKNADHAVMETILLRKDDTPDKILQLYQLASQSGSKGIRICRDVSEASESPEEPLVQEANKNEEEKKEDPVKKAEPKDHSKEQDEAVVSQTDPEDEKGSGNLYVTVNYGGSGKCEIFTNQEGKTDPQQDIVTKA